jgi:hypothetical protein
LLAGFAAFWLVTAAALAQEASPPPGPVKVQTRVDPPKVTIGTPFRYTLSVEAGEDVELLVPLLAERIGDFTIRDFGEVKKTPVNGKVVSERWYDLVTYEPGDKIVPGPPIQYRVAGSDLQRIDAPDALIIVEKLVGDSATEVRDVKPPAAVPRDYTPLWWALAGIALLLGLALGLYRFLNRGRAVAGPPPRPAHEVALAALARLRTSRLIESGQHGEFYVRLSAIVRDYVEARFHLRAPEMTTEEFLQVMQTSPQLAAEHRSLLARFLTEADLVKFARHVPSAEDEERAMEAARRFVESTAEAGGERAAA